MTKKKPTPEQVVCRNIRQLRINARMSQAELARRLGTSQQTISNLEVLSTPPDFIMAMQLCRIFDVAPDELIKTGGVPQS